MMAPMSTALSSGSPTRRVSIRAFSLATSRSATPSCTRIREPAQHTWPWLNQIASTTPSTTLSRSASGKTMNGDFPPSSSESFLPLPAVAARMSRPTSVDPVNAILSTSGWATSASPARPSPVMMLTTPAGSPISSQSSAKRSAVSEVNSAGLSTTVFPMAIAGAIFHASISSGKFHGMIWPITPTGTRPGSSRSMSWAQPAWWRNAAPPAARRCRATPGSACRCRASPARRTSGHASAPAARSRRDSGPARARRAPTTRAGPPARPRTAAIHVGGARLGQPGDRLPGGRVQRLEGLGPGSDHRPPMNSPKRRSWPSSQACAGPAASGAGP